MIFDRQACRDGTDRRPQSLKEWPQAPHRGLPFSAADAQFIEQVFGLSDQLAASLRIVKRNRKSFGS